MRGKIIYFIALLFFTSNMTFAQDIQGRRDHQMLSRYPNSNIKFYYQKEYSELDFPQQSKDAKPADFIQAKGKHTSILYAAPKNISPLGTTKL